VDLRHYLAQLEELGEVQRVEGADWKLEIGTITELMAEKGGPALLFDGIQGYPRGYRIMTNLLDNPRRLAAALSISPELPTIEMVNLIKEKFNEMKPIPPLEVSEGSVLENIQEGGEIDMLRFPAPRWHEGDGGRYIGTADMVIMRDPDADWVNVGTYRVQLHDGDTLGLYISPGHQGRLIRERYWAQGKSCPVAVVFGIHPAIWVPSFLAFPWGSPEYEIAGGLLGRPIEVTRGKYTGLPIPASAEIAIEGECPPPEVEAREEGPFGEWPGYYGSGARNEAVIKVKRIMHRNDPILLGAPPLKPPASGSASHVFRSANLWHELEALGIPEIRGVWHLRAGGSRYFSVISIKQRYAGHAKQVAMAAMSGPEGAYHGRFVIVVDEDIDPSNEQDVLWAMATRCDPATAIEIVKDCWSTKLDPLLPPEKKAKGELTNSRAIIIACKPFHWINDFPRVNRASQELRKRTLNKWKELFPEG
jgi:4-hydroxy-3-polyprenylbenzoate decarboxylase